MKSYVNTLSSLLNLTITKRKKINFTISVVYIHPRSSSFVALLLHMFLTHVSNIPGRLVNISKVCANSWTVLEAKNKNVFIKCTNLFFGFPLPL